MQPDYEKRSTSLALLESHYENTLDANNPQCEIKVDHRGSFGLSTMFSKPYSPETPRKERGQRHKLEKGSTFFL